MLQDKYNRLIIDKLPKEVAVEFKQIKDDTDNFSDEDVMEIYKENFNDLFKIVETKYPEALKAKKKLIKPVKVKIKKPAQSKKKLVKKAEPKKKLVKKADKKENIDEMPCDDAKDELKTIESKKAKAVKARAEAPKKKVSTAAREKQVGALKSLFKTKDFKADKTLAVGFAKDIVSVYKKHKLTLADQLEKDIDALIKSKYKVETMNDGGQLQDEGVDLFEDYENIPENVQAILDKHSEAFEDGEYRALEKALKELNEIGYTFEYYLDGQAYDLRKIGQKGKSEEEE